MYYSIMIRTYRKTPTTNKGCFRTLYSFYQSLYSSHISISSAWA